MDYVDRKGLSHRTVFIYVNDNGWEQPPYAEYSGDVLLKSNGGDKGKLSMYDMSFRTPILFYWPSIISGGIVRRDLVSSMDIMPTILDYLGMDTAGLPGHSLKSVIEGGAKGQREYLIGKATQFRSREDMMGRSSLAYYLRSPDWHFMWFVEDERLELYDMISDPNNDHNVVAKHPELVERFKFEIERWRRQINDT